jgi:hypothetical protein
MKFFAVFIEVTDYQSAKSTLLKFKDEMQGQGGVVVFDLEQSNYDFLYNSLIEKANKELRSSKDGEQG